MYQLVDLMVVIRWVWLKKQNKMKKLPAEYMDAICVVLEWSQLSPENLQSLQDFTVLQILQVLLLQQQELHTLRGRKQR